MKIFRFLNLLLIFMVFSCKEKQPKIPAFNQSYSAYIHSFSSGVISKKSTIKIAFTKPVSDTTGGLEDDLLKFEPAIEGKLVLSDPSTLEFIPAGDLKPGQVYTAHLQLDALLAVPDSLSDFKFGFQALRPDFEWGSVQLVATPETQMDWYSLKGSVVSADEEDLEDIQKLMSAELNGKKLKVNWQNGSQSLQYDFSIDSIQRLEDARMISLKVDKERPGTGGLETRKVELPALGDFKFMDYSVQQAPSGHVRLNFSDPIEPGQNLSGLVTIEGQSNLKLEIDNTGVLVYPHEKVFGIKKLTIFPGIKNIAGYTFKEQKELTIEFKNEKPQVQIIGNGNIIPVNEKLLLPFKAIGLKAVDVRVVKIPETNILQFLQTNNYNGENELYRVGEVLVQKKIDLVASASLKQWNTYSVDIAELVRPESGAIYRVYFSFSKEYSLYECYETEAEEEGEEDYWYYDDYYYYDHSDYNAYDRSDYYFSHPRGYRWRERDNPCHVSYYNSQQFPTRNLLATNLGLIVKRTQTGELDFTVTDMVRNSPISGAEVILYNYQGRKLSSAKTDNEGWASISTEGRPYFAVAEKGNQKTYLKLQQGEALSLSNFDVGGSSVEDGLKGFIYGERGVWRPGDSIYLNFMLEDEMNRLPKGHPINFSLTDPRGMVVDQQINYKGDSRIYDFRTATAGSAVTGSYTAHVRVGDRNFSERVRIETVKPNRLKVNLDFDEEIIQPTDGNVTTDLAVEWLTGVPAANAKVNITANITSVNTAFEKWPKFTFNDPVKEFSAMENQVFEGTVGEEGKAKPTLNIGTFTNAPGMLKSRFVVKAFEGGGEFSTEYFDKQIAPYQQWIGLQVPKPQRSYYLETDKDHEIKVKTLDYKGNPLSLKNLEVKVYKIEGYWWYNSQNSGLARFVNNESTYLISKGEVSTVNGDGTYTLNVPYPNWGRFLIRICDPNGGHCTGQVFYMDWPASRKGNRPELAGSTLLNFSAEKEKYQIGEDIVVQIPVSKDSRVLMTVENGSGILKKEWIKAEGETVEYRVKATAEMAPNVYIAASLLQPHAQTVNDRAIRLYGVIPVDVYDPETELKPQITTKEVWRPETRVKVSVSEKNSRAMSYTLAVVDDGLLNLTRFKTPDPWNHFYAKEALGVTTWDMYNDVLGAFGGKLEQVFAIGGDAALNKMENSNLNRFVPMVRFLGPFQLKEGATADHEISVPNYVGSVRVMVVAADAENAYGNSEKSVKVRKPLMVLNTLPRVLSPGDEVTLPVTVFAMEEQVRDVLLSLKVNGDVQIVGESSKRVKFSKNGEKVVDFKLKVPEVWGKATVRVEASSGREKAYDETHLKVRLPNPSVTESELFFLEAGKDTTLTYRPLGVEGTNFLTLQASTIPLVNLEKRLHYLLSYPYGCTEQTVSTAFPQLFLGDIMGLSADMKRVRNQNINIALQKIYERQASNGAIAYWPGNYNSPYMKYVTSYAGHFLMEAERKGYQVGSGVLARWKLYQKREARGWRPEYTSGGRLKNDIDQSYRLYTLALAKEAEVGAMNRLREVENLSSPALWQLAACYMMIGQKNEAEKLAARADEDGSGYFSYWYFGSGMRNQAIKLMVLNQLERRSEALELGRDLAKNLNRDYWYSTHSLAFSLIAIIQTYGTDTGKKRDMKWAYKAPADTYESNTPGSFQTHAVKKNLDGEYTYTISNKSSMPVNFAVTQTGTPINYDLPAVSSNLSVSVNYTYPGGEYIDVGKIRQGQDFEARVTVKRFGTEDGYENMALSQLFPSGWEIINTRLLETDQKDEDSYDYKDIRDDRVNTFFSMTHSDRKSVTFKVRLNATYAGRYWLPPVKAHDMYNNEIIAREPGRWVEVVRE